MRLRVVGWVAAALLVGSCAGTGSVASLSTSESVATAETSGLPVATTVDPIERPSTTPTSAVSPPSTTVAPAALSDAGRAVEANRVLRRTLNIGGVLEVPLGEDWAITLRPEDIDQIAQVGFTAVRLPIRWSDWAETEPPFAIDPEIHRRVDEVVDRALANGLGVIIDVHHYEEMGWDPAGHRDRFLAIWRQIAEHNADLPPGVVFEVINEPNGALEGEVLNRLLVDSVSVIRESNPDRTIMVGPGQWYAPLELDSLALPDDGNLIVSVHYYDPFEFTHQGASWVAGSEAWLGTGWSGETERERVAGELESVGQWAADRGVPVFIGEFGVVSVARPEDRAEWFAAVVEESEARGFSWGYWDWATTSFGVYDQGSEAWDEMILDSLLGPKQ